jgi:hypothetical protein
VVAPMKRLSAAMMTLYSGALLRRSVVRPNWIQETTAELYAVGCEAVRYRSSEMPTRAVSICTHADSARTTS